MCRRAIVRSKKFVWVPHCSGRQKERSAYPNHRLAEPTLSCDPNWHPSDRQSPLSKNIERRVPFRRLLVPARIRGASPIQSESRRRDGRRGFDGHSTAARLHQTVVRNTGTETGVWAASVVVRHPFLEDQTEMPTAHWSFQHRQTHCGNRAVDGRGIDAVAVVNEKAWRLIAGNRRGTAGRSSRSWGAPSGSNTRSGACRLLGMPHWREPASS